VLYLRTSCTSLFERHFNRPAKIDPHNGFLIKELAVNRADLVDLAARGFAVPFSIEQDDHAAFLFDDRPRSGPKLPGGIDHSQSVGKSRRNFVREKF